MFVVNLVTGSVGLLHDVVRVGEAGRLALSVDVILRGGDTLPTSLPLKDAVAICDGRPPPHSGSGTLTGTKTASAPHASPAHSGTEYEVEDLPHRMLDHLEIGEAGFAEPIDMDFLDAPCDDNFPAHWFDTPSVWGPGDRQAEPSAVDTLLRAAAPPRKKPTPSPAAARTPSAFFTTDDGSKRSIHLARMEEILTRHLTRLSITQ